MGQDVACVGSRSITISLYLKLIRGKPGQIKTGVRVLYTRPAFGVTESAGGDEKIPKKDV